MTCPISSGSIPFGFTESKNNTQTKKKKNYCTTLQRWKEFHTANASELLYMITVLLLAIFNKNNGSNAQYTEGSIMLYLLYEAATFIRISEYANA